MPSSASFTIAVRAARRPRVSSESFSDSAAGLAARRRVGVGVLAAVGLPFERVAEPCDQRLRGPARVSAWSDGQHLVELHRRGGLGDRDRVAVVELGRAGVPGLRSTKKLPSRKMRGRIFSVASAWIGRPSSLIAIVTTACRRALLALDLL